MLNNKIKKYIKIKKRIKKLSESTMVILPNLQLLGHEIE